MSNRVSIFKANLALADDLTIVHDAAADPHPGLLIENAEGNRYAVLHAAIERYDVDAIFAVLRGEREARELRHMTRIVGYFSAIEDWNASKVGELKGRRAGEYTVPGEGA